MRRTVALLLVGVAILGPGVPSAHATLPPPKTVGIYPDLYTSPNCHVLPDVTVRIGQGIVWKSHSGVTRTITQLQGFWKFSVGAGLSTQRRMHSAGTFVERCDAGTWRPSHQIDVPVRAPSHTNRASFRVQWANSGSPSTVRYDVRYRGGGTSGFTTWKDRTTRRWAIFNGAHGKTYQFEARSIRSGKATDWSDPIAVVVS